MEEVSFTKRLFGGEIEFIFYETKKELVEPIIEETYEEALRLQKIFNFYDSESELSKLNRGRNIPISKELHYVLKEALKLSKLTNGKYDISLGKQINARKKGETVRTNCSYKDILIKGGNVSLKNNEILIDLGSIAKGHITDKLAEFLSKKGVREFVIDSRGDIVFFGSLNHIIDIQHPRSEEKTVCTLKIKNKALATSGDYMQFHKSYKDSHLLNATNLISVSVIASTLMKADSLATAIFVSKETERKKLIKKYKDSRVMTVDKDLKINYYNKFEELIE